MYEDSVEDKLFLHASQMYEYLIADHGDESTEPVRKRKIGGN
jgi:hypothetical protein